MDAKSKFTAFMIISEVVITAIAFVGAYYIFKPLLKPKDTESKPSDADKQMESKSNKDPEDIKDRTEN